MKLLSPNGVRVGWIGKRSCTQEPTECKRRDPKHFGSEIPRPSVMYAKTRNLFFHHWPLSVGSPEVLKVGNQLDCHVF